jgi:hypothetical protein
MSDLEDSTTDGVPAEQSKPGRDPDSVLLHPHPDRDRQIKAAMLRRRKRRWRLRISTWVDDIGNGIIDAVALVVSVALTGAVYLAVHSSHAPTVLRDGVHGWVGDSLVGVVGAVLVGAVVLHLVGDLLAKLIDFVSRIRGRRG